MKAQLYFPNKTTIAIGAIWTAILLGTSACEVGTSSLGSSASSGAYTTTATLTTPTATPSPTPSASPTVTGSEPPYSFTVRATGYNNASITVSAGQVLKVTFAPGIQDTPVAGTGYYPEYSMLGVHVVVGSNDQAMPMLTNGYNGTAAETSSVMNYSSGLPCTGSSASCRSTVTIQVTMPNNDYYCMNYDMYCSWAQMYYSHPWNGVLTVQTDDTTAI